jgi:hypothetical protein
MILVKKDNKKFVPTRTTSLLTRWIKPQSAIANGACIDATLFLENGQEIPVKLIKDSWEWIFLLTPEAVSLIIDHGRFLPLKDLVRRTRGFDEWSSSVIAVGGRGSHNLPYRLARAYSINPAITAPYSMCLRCYSPSAAQFKMMGVKYLELMLEEGFKENVLGS